MPKLGDLRAKINASDAGNKAEILTDIDALGIDTTVGDLSAVVDHAFLAKMADKIREGMVPGDKLDTVNAKIKKIVLGVKPVFNLGHQVLKQS